MVVRICSSVAYFLVGFFFFGTCEFYESFLLKQVDTGLCLRNAHRDIILFSSVRCLENKKFCLQKKPKKNNTYFAHSFPSYVPEYKIIMVSPQTIS